jgi:hypothetical protein
MQKYQQLLQEIKDTQKKKVRFNNKVYIREIPYIKDLLSDILIKDLYYTSKDYEKFKRTYIFELYYQTNYNIN